MSSSLSPVTSGSEFSFIDNASTRSRSSTLQSVDSDSHPATARDNFSAPVQTGTDEDNDSGSDDFVFLTRNPIRRNSTTATGPLVISEDGEGDDRIRARPRVSRPMFWADDEEEESPGVLVITDDESDEGECDSGLNEDSAASDEIGMAPVNQAIAAILDAPIVAMTGSLHISLAGPVAISPVAYPDQAYAVSTPTRESLVLTPTPNTPTRATSSLRPVVPLSTALPQLPVLKATEGEKRNKTVVQLSEVQESVMDRQLPGLLDIPVGALSAMERSTAYNAAKLTLETTLRPTIQSPACPPAGSSNTVAHVFGEKIRSQLLGSLTLAQTAELLMEAAERLNKPINRLTKGEVRAAKERKVSNILRNLPSTGNAQAHVKAVVRHQIMEAEKENKQLMVNTAAAMGKSVSELARGERKRARELEIAAIRARLPLSHVSAVASSRGPTIVPDSSSPDIVAQQRSQDTNGHIRQIKLTSAQTTEVLCRATSAPGKPVVQFTKQQRKKARRRERKAILAHVMPPASRATTATKLLVPATIPLTQSSGAIHSAPDTAATDNSLPHGAPALDPEQLTSESYQEIVDYITSYINSPPPKPSPAVRLHFHQCLIIELGLLASVDGVLPTTNAAAKKLLKEHAFLNVAEYVASRTRPMTGSPSGEFGGQGVGPEELQRLMYPSQSALIKGIITKRRDSISGGKVPLDWIKKRGLTVFLVPVYRAK